MLEEKAVDRGLPFHRTSDEDIKSAPVTVKVKSVPPAFAEFGLSETMLGVGFRGGGGGLLPELPEPPDPPPQPVKNCRQTRHASATIPLRRFTVSPGLFLSIIPVRAIAKKFSDKLESN